MQANGSKKKITNERSLNKEKTQKGFYLNSQTIFTDFPRNPSPSAITRRCFRQLHPPYPGCELPRRHGGMRRSLLLPAVVLERIAAAAAANDVPLSSAVVDLPLGQGGFRPAPFSGVSTGQPKAAGRSSGMAAAGPPVRLEIGVRRGGCNGRREWAQRAGGVAGDLHRRRWVLAIRGRVYFPCFSFYCGKEVRNLLKERTIERVRVRGGWGFGEQKRETEKEVIAVCVWLCWKNEVEREREDSKCRDTVYRIRPGYFYGQRIFLLPSILLCLKKQHFCTIACYFGKMAIISIFKKLK